MQLINLKEGDYFSLGGTQFFVLSLGEEYTAVLTADIVNQIHETKETENALKDVKDWIQRTAVLTDREIYDCRLISLREIEFYKKLLDANKASMTWLATGNSKTDYRRINPRTNEMDMDKKRVLGIRPVFLLKSNILVFGSR